MIDEELKKSSEEQDTEETTAGKATEQEASTTEEVKDTETKDSDAKDAGETENAEQSATSETSDAETEKLKKKYEDALAEQKDKYILTREELENKIATFTGGRAAEEVKFGQVSTGAANDIEQADREGKVSELRFRCARSDREAASGGRQFRTGTRYRRSGG